MRVSKNTIAKEIKIIDIEDNMNDRGNENMDKEDDKKINSLRTKRYIPALLFLKGNKKEY